MKLQVFSIYDRKARGYGALMGFVNEEVARRAVLQVIAGDSEISKFPGDFDMFYLADMDSETGVIEPGTPQPVFNCGDLLKAAQGG